MSVANYKSPLGLNVELLESSFDLLSPRGEELVRRFYEELFRRYPGVMPLFSSTSIDDQEKKLLAALKLVVTNLRKPDVLGSALHDLGQRHKGYGVKQEHYSAVSTTLVDVMKEIAGDVWNKDIENAWSHALSVVSNVMIDAYASEAEAGKKATEPKKPEDSKMNNNSENISDAQELARLRTAVDGAMQAIMMIDRDFNITYANQATMDLLKRHEYTLRHEYPGFRVDNLIGECIDIFHKNPAHQRKLLADPANLPYSTDIKIADLYFKLNVTAMIDDTGEYIGNTLEWADITTEIEKSSQAARLQSAIDASMQAIMMVDRDFIVTYVNQSSMDLLTKYQVQMSAVFPGFSPAAIVGSCIDMFHRNPAHQRKLLDDPNNLPYQTDIAIGELRFSLNVTAIIDANGKYVGNTLEWSDVTAVRQKEFEVARLQSAVDGSEANLMICDNDLNITYANPAVIKMMSARSEQLRRIFPGFDATNLVGQNIDQFHKNPSHQRRILGDPANLPTKAEINVAGLEFSVNATAIVDHEGKFMGNMVEWGDITERKDAERQIQSMIDNAVSGKLDVRIDESQYTGFMKVLTQGINKLMEAVVEPLRESQRVIKLLSEGDLTQQMVGEYAGEYADLRDALNSTTDVLADMVDQIIDSSETILTSSDEIARGNADLSQRTEEQASSLEETASSMEEMTSTVRQNADNAREANKLASAARDQAEKGGDVVQKAVDAMSDINSSSKKIADIISVIDEIAFQTNLLALNAAVEAARAGEQGKGFAVVAGEVRNLAQRSAGAAKEIKGLINDSVDKVSEGSRLVDDSGKTLQDIVASVKKVSDIIAEIAAAGIEQSAGIEEVNRAIAQMDEMTQQNAALVEEATAASESMNEEVKAMNELMEFFILDEEEPVKVVPKRRRRKSRTQYERPSAFSSRSSSQKKRRTPARVEDDDDEWEEF